MKGYRRILTQRTLQGRHTIAPHITLAAADVVALVCKVLHSVVQPRLPLDGLAADRNIPVYTHTAAAAAQSLWISSASIGCGQSEGLKAELRRQLPPQACAPAQGAGVSCLRVPLSPAAGLLPARNTSVRAR